MLFIGSDHAGFELKEAIRCHLDARGIPYKDLGAQSLQAVDYANVAGLVGTEVARSSEHLGLLFCGTGVGISIAANKIKGIRAACCSDYFSAKYTRVHNDANILCLGGRVVGAGLATELVDVFLDTPFCNEERHARRIQQIAQLEKE